MTNARLAKTWTTNSKNESVKESLYNSSQMLTLTLHLAVVMKRFFQFCRNARIEVLFLSKELSVTLGANFTNSNIFNDNKDLNRDFKACFRSP